jgi:agmatinase
MTNHELYTSQTNIFSGIQTTYQNADYIILGVPFDNTSTYRTGARFGPDAIRQASLNIETYSFRTNTCIENLKLHDLGNLHTSTDTNQTLQALQKVITDITKNGKIPFTLGGEHTITLGTVKGLTHKTNKTAIISFDAHLDLRDEYNDLTVSHTTFMRRLNEQTKPKHIIEIGTRAACKEELDYAKKADITIHTTQQIQKQGPHEVIKQISEQLADTDYLYITIDMDILDPAYAPAVQNPEADGLTTNTLLDIITSITDSRTQGFDVLEIAPNYDQGISAITSAKIAFETLLQIEKARKHR